MSREKYFTDFLSTWDALSIVMPRFSEVDTLSGVIQVIKSALVIGAIRIVLDNLQFSLFDDVSSNYLLVHVELPDLYIYYTRLKPSCL
jgi:hypothetical protein